MKGKLQRQYNLTFGERSNRLAIVRREIQRQIRCTPKGKGNRAWGRLEAMRHGSIDLGVAIIY